MLMVTTSMGMLYGIFRHTTNLRPAVALDRVFVVGTSSHQHGLIGTATSGDDTNLGTDSAGDGLLTSRRKTQTGSSLVLVVGDDNGKGTRASGKSTAISLLGLNVADDSSLGNHVQRQDISDGQSGLLSAVDELSGVHTLGTDEQLGVSLIPVGIKELNLGDGGTTTRVMQDFLDNATDVSLLLGIVEGTKLDSSLASPHMGLEDGGLTLTLGLSIFK
jgi:hypothetical protein